MSKVDFLDLLKSYVLFETMSEFYLGSNRRRSIGHKIKSEEMIAMKYGLKRFHSKSGSKVVEILGSF